MLVVISDLHFVDETAGAHNLPVGAFEDVFLSSIVSLARDKVATELVLLLLGDMPDLVRSQQWFEEAEVDRPWGVNGLADVVAPRPDSKTEARCLKILGQLPPSRLKSDVEDLTTILYCNWEIFAFFRELPSRIQNEFGLDIPVELVFVPGNHDRLVNLYPSVRDAWQEMTGASVPAGNEWYAYDYLNTDYKVHARHGHHFDPFNYAGGAAHAQRQGNLLTPVGDAIATEFAVALPYTLEKLKSTHPCITDDLVEALKEIDNIRPISRLIEWFYFRVRREPSADVRKALDAAFDTVLKQFLDLQFVQTWHSDDSGWDTLFRWASKGPLRWLINQLLKITNVVTLAGFFLPVITYVADSDNARDTYAEGAYKEPNGQENDKVRYIVYGHTHVPTVQPLNGAGGKEVLYVNSGTWRNRIHRTIDLDKAADFIALKQMTYAVFYKADEDTSGKQPQTVSFDIWTGNKQKYYSE